MEDWERINTIIKIDLYIANKLIQSFDKKAIVKNIKYLAGGKRTSNYRVQLNNSSQYLLLKIYENDENSCVKEYAVHKKLRNIIPIPEYFFSIQVILFLIIPMPLLNSLMESLL